jgi:hypothetical protein
MMFGSAIGVEEESLGCRFLQCLSISVHRCPQWFFDLFLISKWVGQQSQAAGEITFIGTLSELGLNN